MKAIEIKNLSKKYDELKAVDDLNLAIEEGELFALLGVNGAGKTTTIKMLSCLVKPTVGEAVILGDDVKENPFSIKQKINISPQETAVAENLSIIENLELIAGIYGQNAKNAKQSAKEIAARFGLEDNLRKKAKYLQMKFFAKS